MNYMAIGNDELDVLPPLGDTIHCPHCGGEHKVERGKKQVGGEWVEDNTLAFYRCGEHTYLCGIDGKDITR